MKKQTVLYILLFILISSGPVVILTILNNKNNQKSYGFYRKFISEKITPVRETELGYPHYYIAGSHKEKLYLSNTDKRDQLLEINFSFSSSKTIKLLNFSGYKVYWPGVVYAVNSPYIFAMESLSPSLLVANIDSSQNIIFQKNIDRFSKATPISPVSYIFRMHDFNLDQYTLVKQTIPSKSLKPITYLLERQETGIFSTDGMLLYNSSNHELMYLYYYRNQFVALDTNLNVLYKSNTIDTISQAQIQRTDTVHNTKVTISSPPLMVNKRSCTSGSWMFVNSDLRAENESVKDYRNSFTIDVYSINSGKYQFSFHIPKKGNEQLYSIYATNKYFYAIIDKKILCYGLYL